MTTTDPTRASVEAPTDLPAEITDEHADLATEDTPPAPEPTFADFNVHPDIVEALAAHGIVHPFPIQAMTLPVALGGHDIIGQAKTGTGKTLGFGIPMLQRAVAQHDEGYAALARPGKPQALAVAPTRELAVQVAGDLERAGAKRGVRVLTVYGGRAYEPQIEALRKGVDIVVGTPGRLIDLAKQGHLDLSQARTVVLDEADEMLDLGFLPDVETLMALTPASRQTMLFSATMPGAIVALARRYMSQPTHIRAMGDETENAHTVKAIEQFVYRAHSLDKVELLSRVLQADGRGLTLIFTRTKRTAAKVADELTERGFAAAAIHGDLGQGAREQALRAFRNGKVDVLVATDVAARGIDVENVTHVVNYQCPEDEKTYVHRIGRTGRAGNTGIAITLVDWEDMPRWSLIDRQLDLGIPDPQETYSSSEHLYTDLDIRPDIKGYLPSAKRTRAGLDAEMLEDLGETGGRRRSGGGGGGGGRAGRSGGRDGGRGDRDGGRGDRAGGRGGHGPRESSGSTDEHGESGSVERRPRNRRRTRGGAGGAEGGGESAGTAPRTEAQAGDRPADGSDSGGCEGGARRPRRRRRRGGGSGNSGGNGDRGGNGNSGGNGGATSNDA
ncbi:MAG TPA: DEAD/DEAH box helicase [Dermatophilaceae bacterium]|nr:DEAD/DEAH box helicase [Dermatophilaceae bacterium]